MLITKRHNNYLQFNSLPSWTGKMIDDVLRNEFQVPKKLLHQWRMNKSILLNDEVIHFETIFSNGDTLSLPIYATEENDIPSYEYNLIVAYEDDDILIVEKPNGMNTHPDSPEQKDTLLNAVSFYFHKNNILARPRHIHRLDRETTGLVLFGKNAYITSHLDRLLEQKKIKRSYAAFVEGIVKKEKGTIRTNIARDRHTNRMRVSSTGQLAITHYEVLERFQNKQQSLVKCNLETGRTHQIRVHLSSIGHPLVGDSLYGAKPNKMGQMLHAYQIEFIHPLNGRKIVAKSPINFMKPKK